MAYNRFQLPATAEMEIFFTTHRVEFEEKNAAILTALRQKTIIDSGPNKQIGYQWLEIQPRPDSYQKGDWVTISCYTHMMGVGAGAYATGLAYIHPANKVNM
ncbi:MAG: hypothetical protein ABR516_00970 [Desulfuromonadaceae bacterium]